MERNEKFVKVITFTHSWLGPERKSVQKKEMYRIVAKNIYVQEKTQHCKERKIALRQL